MLTYRIQQFYEDVKELTERSGSQSAFDGSIVLFNALLDEVKKETPDDPIVAAMAPAEKEKTINLELRQAAGQLKVATELPTLGGRPRVEW